MPIKNWILENSDSKSWQVIVRASRGNEAEPALGDNIAHMNEKDFLPALVANNILTNQHKEQFGSLGVKQSKKNALDMLKSVILGQLTFSKFKSPDENAAVKSDAVSPAKSEDVDLVEQLLEEKNKSEQAKEADPIGKILADVLNTTKTEEGGVVSQRYSNKTLKDQTIVKSEFLLDQNQNLVEATVVEEGGKLSTLQTFKNAVDNLALGINKSLPQETLQNDMMDKSFDDFGIPKSEAYSPAPSKYSNLKN